MEERIEWLSQHPLVQLAARVGERFAMDPIAVLRDRGDPLLNEVRAAALLVTARDEKRRQDAERRR